MKTGWYEDAFYARSDRGLWVKSVLDYEAGEISLHWHARRKRIGGTVFTTIDENGEACNQLQGWVDAGAIGMDREFMIKLLASTDVKATEVYRAISEHIAMLLVCGFGESASDVLDVFVENLMVAGADYEVISIEGLEGAVLSCGDEEYKILVPGDNKTYSEAVPTDLGELTKLMLSTRPVNEERKLSLLSLRGQFSPRGVAPL